jgi:hypothetical protein
MQTQGFNRFRDLFSGKNKKNTSRKYIQYDEGTLPSERSGASQNPTSNK